MDSKLLEIVRNNGTGILKGNFRADILKENDSLGGFNDTYRRRGKLIVSFSKDECALGTHLLIVEKMYEEKGTIFCIILNRDGTEYRPSDNFKDPVSIILIPFTHSCTDDTIGEFIAEFPMGPLDLE